jgi:DNA polymerase-3 subunit gamma/tau
MSQNRAALARTYRPRRFGEVAMQEHVAETLRTAVARGRVAHAYLFTGPRGVGKTTAARVLAMALNCPNRSDGSGDLREGEPCGECESCASIWAGRTSLDVIEIDAASNRGVDDARDLRERAMYAPTDEFRYKVYIIDEAHMLTREAWNALLKILEEPPPRVIFVFATTEPQKILQSAPPILSRCQRFDFRRIPVDGILLRLRAVLAAEGVEADDDALVPIARKAEGGMRDALSLLDQVMSFAEGRITEPDVRLVLGLIGDELYLQLFGIIGGKQYGDVFRFVDRLLAEGYDLTEFYRGLADALRTLLEVKFDGDVPTHVREDLRPVFTATAAAFGGGDLLRMLAMVSELDVEGRFRKSGNPRTMLEALLLRFAWLDRTVAIEDLLAVASGSPPPPDPIGATGSGGGTIAGRPQPTGSPPGSRSTGPDSAGEPHRPTAPAESVPPLGDSMPAAAGGRGAVAAAVRAPQQAAVRSAPDRARPARTADEALGRLIRKRDSVPSGLLFFLPAGQARMEGDTVVLELPPGPGLERLMAEVGAQRALQAAFAEELGVAVRLDVRARAGETDRSAEPRRLTPEGVRSDQLARLTRADPLLGEAVERWDLELLD